MHNSVGLVLVLRLHQLKKVTPTSRGGGGKTQGSSFLNNETLIQHMKKNYLVGPEKGSLDNTVSSL